MLNGADYPHLHYPEIYILEGGYSQFFKTHAQLCDPKNYVEMRDEMFRGALKSEKMKRGGSFASGRMCSFHNPSQGRSSAIHFQHSAEDSQQDKPAHQMMGVKKGMNEFVRAKSMMLMQRMSESAVTHGDAAHSIKATTSRSEVMKRLSEAAASTKNPDINSNEEKLGADGKVNSSTWLKERLQAKPGPGQWSRRR